MTTEFQVVSPFQASGDQPAAIDQLYQGIEAGLAYQRFISLSFISRLLKYLAALLRGCLYR